MSGVSGLGTVPWPVSAASFSGICKMSKIIIWIIGGFSVFAIVIGLIVVGLLVITVPRENQVNQNDTSDRTLVIDRQQGSDATPEKLPGTPSSPWWLEPGLPTNIELTERQTQQLIWIESASVDDMYSLIKQTEDAIKATNFAPQYDNVPIPTPTAYASVQDHYHWEGQNLHLERSDPSLKWGDGSSWVDGKSHMYPNLPLNLNESIGSNLTCAQYEVLGSMDYPAGIDQTTWMLEPNYMEITIEMGIRRIYGEDVGDISKRSLYLYLFKSGILLQAICGRLMQ